MGGGDTPKLQGPGLRRGGAWSRGPTQTHTRLRLPSPEAGLLPWDLDPAAPCLPRSSLRERILSRCSSHRSAGYTVLSQVTHGAPPRTGDAPGPAPRPWCCLARPPWLMVGVAPTFFFHVVTLAFSSDPLLNLPTPFKSLFVCLLWVWGGAISLVWSANVEFLGDKMRSQVGRDSDPPPRLPGHRRLPGHSAGLPVLPPRRPLGRLCPQQQPGGAVETKVGHLLKLLQ